MTKNTKIILIAVVLIAVVGAIYFYEKNNSGRSGVIKIGFIAPLTGDFANFGQPVHNAEVLAVEQINAAGGINGKQIQAIYEDGKCNGQDAVSAAQKLINIDGVKAIIGGFCSGETVPVVPIAEQNKVLLFSPGASSPALTNSSPYFFRDYPSDAAQGEMLADVAYNKKNWRLVAFVQEQTDWAVALYGAFSKRFESLGGKVINESFPSNATDLRSLLAKLKAQNPDALFLDIQMTPAIERVLRQMKELGWKPPLFSTDVIMSDSQLMSANAVQLEGALAAEFLPNAGDPKFQQFIQAYRAKYGQQDPPMQNYLSAVYDAVYLLRDGIAAVGYDGAKLATWSRTINGWQGASGAITINAAGDRIGSHTLEIIHNGQKVPI